MILIALGSNLPSRWGDSRQTLEMALASFGGLGINVVRQSQWYRTRAVNTRGLESFLDQPAFINGVVRVETVLPPEVLHRRLRALEVRFGYARRQRPGAKVAPRALDLDLIDYHGRVTGSAKSLRGRQAQKGLGLTLPHPGVPSRAFVLLPLLEVAPRWRYPGTGETAARLAQNLPKSALAAVTPLD